MVSCGFLCCLIRLKLNRSEFEIRRCAPHTIATNLCQQVVNWLWSMANGLIQTNFELKFIGLMGVCVCVRYVKSKDNLCVNALQCFMLSRHINDHQSSCMRSQLRDFCAFHASNKNTHLFHISASWYLHFFLAPSLYIRCVHMFFSCFVFKQNKALI